MEGKKGASLEFSQVRAHNRKGDVAVRSRIPRVFTGGKSLLLSSRPLGKWEASPNRGVLERVKTGCQVDNFEGRGGRTKKWLRKTPFKEGKADTALYGHGFLVNEK